jgi:iron complex outermembrane receptor protein
MGGVIISLQKQPSNIANGFAELTVGNYGQQRYSAGGRIPVIKNKLFAGASVMYSQRDGYYTNEFNNTDF